MAASVRQLGWQQVAASFVLLGLSAMIIATFGLLAIPLGREFAVSRTMLMLPITLCAGMSALISPVLGGAMDRLPMRALMALGVVLLAAAYAAVSLAGSMLHIYLVFAFLMAPANVLIGPVAVTVLVSRWFVASRGKAIGISMVGLTMGGLVMAPVMQALLSRYDWRTALQVLAVIILVGGLVAAALVIGRPADRQVRAFGEADAPASGALPAAPPAHATRTILSTPSFWLLAAVVATVTSGMTGVVTNLTPLATDQGIDAGRAAALISVFTAGSLVSKLAFAGLADRMRPTTMLYIVLAGFAVGMACLIGSRSGYWIITLGAALIALFGGMAVSLQGYLASKIFDAGIVGRALGLLSTVMLVPLLATPPLFGAVFDRTGNYDLVFMVFTALAALAMLAVPRLQPRGEPRLAVAA